jgi:hypothetical protein
MPPSALLMACVCDEHTCLGNVENIFASFVRVDNAVLLEKIHWMMGDWGPSQWFLFNFCSSYAMCNNGFSVNRLQLTILPIFCFTSWYICALPRSKAQCRSDFFCDGFFFDTDWFCCVFTFSLYSSPFKLPYSSIVIRLSLYTLWVPSVIYVGPNQNFWWKSCVL